MADFLTFSATGYPSDLLNFVKQAPRFSKTVGPRIARKVAAKFLQRLVDFWYSQKFGLAPLNPGYVAHKESQGLDQRILIASHELISKMQIFDVDKNNYVAGVSSTEVHTGTGVTLANIMQALEFGSPSQNIPSRPIFGLTRDAVEEELVKLVNDELRKEAEFYFKKHLARLRSKKLKEIREGNNTLLKDAGFQF